MFERIRKKGLALAVSALTVASLGIATPAYAVDTYEPDEAMLTKVIDAPIGTNTKQDTYVFQFTGGGTVEETATGLVSDGVAQDTTTLKVDDVVPTIPDVTFSGVEFTADNTLQNGQVAQGVVQKSISQILSDNNVSFPHAGVYTYVVTETAVNPSAANREAGYYVNSSQAEYILRIRVSNTKTTDASELTNRELTVESVTVEQTKDDNGDNKGNLGKVDPTYPTADDTYPSKIDETSDGESPATNELAGDGRGRDVPGFTFANEYIKGGEFKVTKLYDGDHSDRTKYSTVQLVVYSEAATNPDAVGACITYRIEGDGIDLTDNTDNYGEHQKLNGINTNISQTNDFMMEFDANGYAYIEADLKEDSYILITGEFGPYNAEFEDDPASVDGNRRMILSTSGLLVGQTYWVIERNPGDYIPKGYVYVGSEAEADPRKEASGMKETLKLAADTVDPTDTSAEPATIPAGALLLSDSATGSATTVFVVNTLDESNVSPTGILINNLPYILMVGGPLAIFAIMFVSKRRRNAAA